MKKTIYALIAVLLLIACGGQVKIERPDYSKYTWPQPPHQPRVKLLNVIITDLDIRQRSSQELLFGERVNFAFKKPHGIAVDKDGNILVSDTYQGKVFSLNPDTGSIGELFNPYGWRELAGLATDNVNGLIAATSGNTVVVLDQNSKKAVFNLGPREGFSRPVGLAFDPARKRLYVADSKKHEVHAFDYEGKHLAKIAGVGNARGEVYFPDSVAVSPDGKIYVVDAMNFRVQVFNPDYTFNSEFGEHGDLPGMFARPKSVAINRDGIVFVTDAAFGNFQIFLPGNRVFGFVGAPGEGPGRFNQPQGIATDDKGRIFVVDQTNRRVQVFQWLSKEYLQAHPEEIVNQAEFDTFK